MEAVKLQSLKADLILNSKLEHKQPKLHRVVMTRVNDEQAGEGIRGGPGSQGRRRGNKGAALRAQGSKQSPASILFVSRER